MKNPYDIIIKSSIKTSINNNRFFKFVKDYYYFLRQVKFDFDRKDRIVVNCRLFSKEKKYIVPESLSRELKTLQFDRYNRVGYYQICNINIDINQWFWMVREFIIFLNNMELSSLYKNDKGDSIIYVDCDRDNSSDVLYYYDETKETEYRISFIDTDIPKPGQISSQLVTFINGVDDKDTNVTLIQIDILRRYGDKRTNQIKLIADQITNKQFLSNEEDRVIFNVIRDIISQVIYNTFDDILNNVNKIVGFDRNITEEVLHGHIKLSEK